MSSGKIEEHEDDVYIKKRSHPSIRCEGSNVKEGTFKTMQQTKNIINSLIVWHPIELLVTVGVIFLVSSYKNEQLTIFVGREAFVAICTDRLFTLRNEMNEELNGFLLNISAAAIENSELMISFFIFLNVGNDYFYILQFRS